MVCVRPDTCVNACELEWLKFYVCNHGQYQDYRCDERCQRRWNENELCVHRVKYCKPCGLYLDGEDFCVCDERDRFNRTG
jgi:hypothetical protein